MKIGTMQRIRNGFKGFGFVNFFVDLLIVFIGVYLAFIFAEYQQDLKKQKEINKVIGVLQIGVSRMEGAFSGAVGYHERYDQNFTATLETGEIPHYGFQTYVAPQYPIDAIKYLSINEGYELFDLDVYVTLTEFYGDIQRIMYVEEKIVEAADRYRPLPPESDPAYERIYGEQMYNARRYLQYMNQRGEISGRLAKLSGVLNTMLLKYKETKG